MRDFSADHLVGSLVIVCILIGVLSIKGCVNDAGKRKLEYCKEAFAHLPEAEPARTYVLQGCPGQNGF